MTLVSNYSILGLILDSSLLAKIILGILLLLSLLSWYVIVQKWFKLNAVKQLATQFASEFWQAKDLQQFYQQTKDQPYSQSPDAVLYRIFEEGLFAYLHNKKQIGEATHATASEVVALSDQAMLSRLEKERASFEKSLSFLATVGSVSPYIGLLGTVLGIMNAFLSLGSAQTTTLASVAPGIAEALIATAFGLFAAIPALVAYNHFVQAIDRIERQMTSFMSDFGQVLHKHLMIKAS